MSQQEKFCEQKSKLKPLQIVLDSDNRVASFEIPLLEFVRGGGGDYYSYMESSRARLKLIPILHSGDSDEIDDLKKQYTNACFTITKSSELAENTKLQLIEITVTYFYKSQHFPS